jgi:hypothetical protein
MVIYYSKSDFDCARILVVDLENKCKIAGE